MDKRKGRLTIRKAMELPALKQQNSTLVYGKKDQHRLAVRSHIARTPFGRFNKTDGFMDEIQHGLITDMSTVARQ